jgi:SRSO17 transposase
MTRTRPATATVAFIDEYCAQYRSLFTNVRHFEQFTALHLGLLAEPRRKSLPQLAKLVSADAQALHHFLANAEWSVEELRARRLTLLRRALNGAPFLLCLDDTGDRKKGQTTDYVARQDISDLHMRANGVVTVDAYGILGATTFPLLSRVYKPKTRLKEGDIYRTKPQIAIELAREVRRLGFRCSVILADSRYGQSGAFIGALHQLGLGYALAIRSNLGDWMLPGQRIRYTRWSAFDSHSADGVADGASEARFIRELIFGARRIVRCYEITTDRELEPPETIWRIMTNQPGRIERVVGSAFGLRAWIEYEFKRHKDDLGWADYRLTDAAAIERWWELVMSAYLLASLQTPTFAALGHAADRIPTLPAVVDADFDAGRPRPAPPQQALPRWDTRTDWSEHLDTLRLRIQAALSHS